MNDRHAVIAANRFGLGAKPGDLNIARGNPEQWLLNQLTLPDLSSGHPDSGEVLDAFYVYRRKVNRFRQQKMMEKPDNIAGQLFVRMAADTVYGAVKDEHSLNWRLLDFFSNHFSVSGQGGMMKPLAPTLEREAIAPNLLGSFEQMLVAVEQHPAMLVYLDNAKSVGPSTRAAGNKRGLNENLAREILELHTLGVHGGYNLEDIQELAKAISGWSVSRPKESQHGFVFRQATHEPGTRVVLGKVYRDTGIDQGEAILKDLAIHPATAKFVSFKLARHFISDSPSEDLVKAMTETWRQTKGNIKSVVTTMIEHPDAWHPTPAKLKTPREFYISTLRLTGLPLPNARLLVNTLVNLGHAPFGAGSPAGFSDKSSAWDGADALLKRVDWVNMISRQVRMNQPPLELAQAHSGSLLSDHTAKMVSRAESRQQGLALYLMSPEFLRR
ncbi:hypothetical protein GZ77_25110 [Endozoicomonas montiporae]|uniref:DUF1800 domain-containing protein n=2 Tax=Endozoicomonas montiporae TaxID=1027273 RepID=A0A081MYX0_9GAMM|nr:hypothetical protein GZ77_25110 [Endozoicomonas montiporae]